MNLWRIARHIINFNNVTYVKVGVEEVVVNFAGRGWIKLTKAEWDARKHFDIAADEI